MSRVVTDVHSITVCSANAGFMLALTLVVTPLLVVGTFLGILLVVYEPFSWKTPVFLIMLTGFLASMVILPKLCWQALNTCATVDRALRSVSIQKGKKKKIYELGDFKKILLQQVRVPTTNDQYHAFLIGEKGRCHLELVAFSKRGLRNKVLVVAEFLAVPIEEATDVAAFDIAMNNRLQA